MVKTVGLPDILQLCLLAGSLPAASWSETVDCWLAAQAGQPMISVESYMSTSLQQRQAHTACLRRSSLMATFSSMWTGHRCRTTR